VRPAVGFGGLRRDLMAAAERVMRAEGKLRTETATTAGIFNHVDEEELRRALHGERLRSKGLKQASVQR
jgi:hypothetical protein